LIHHGDAVREGSRAPIHEAMRRWPDKWAWTEVVLQNCYSQEELDKAEEDWISHCCSADSGIGYNVHRTCHGGKHTMTIRTRRPMSEEQREFYSIQGKKGASHGVKGAHKNMSEAEREKYREWGKKGAAKSRLLKLHPSV